MGDLAQTESNEKCLWTTMANTKTKKKPSRAIIKSKSTARPSRVKQNPCCTTRIQAPSLVRTCQAKQGSYKSKCGTKTTVVAERSLPRKPLQKKSKSDSKLQGVFSPEVFDNAAKRATDAAPKFLHNKFGYTLPFVGDLSCVVKGFEQTSNRNGIDFKCMVLFEWYYRILYKGVLVEGRHIVKHNYKSVCEKQVIFHIPRNICTTACIVRTSADDSTTLFECVFLI